MRVLHRIRPTTSVALVAILALHGCATSIALIPLDGVEYGHQEIAAAVVGVPVDIGVPLAIGAAMGPPGALVGAVVGVAIAVWDLLALSNLGYL